MLSTFKGMILNIKQVADNLLIDEHSVYRLTKRFEIPAFIITVQLRFRNDKWLIEGFLNKCL